MAAERSDRRQRGGALIGVVVLLPLILIGLAAYSQRGLTEMDAARAESYRYKAHYIAHAALQKAVRAYLDDPDYREAGSNIPFGAGYYSFEVRGSESLPELGDRVRIAVTGFYKDRSDGDTVRTLTVIGKRGLGPSPLDYAASTRGRIVLGGGAQIGDKDNKYNVVYSGNGDPATEDISVTGGGGATIFGKAEVVTEVAQKSPPLLDPGPIEYGVKPIDFPTYDLNTLRWKAQTNLANPQYPGGTYFSGDKTFDGEELKGIIFVEGRLDFRNDVDVVGTIVHSGPDQVRVSGLFDIAPEEDPSIGAPGVAMICVGGPVLFSTGAIVRIEGFVFSDDEITFRSDGRVKGGLVAEKEVNLSGKCQVDFELLDPVQFAEEVTIYADWIFQPDSWVEGPREEGASGGPTGPPGPTGPSGPSGPAPPPF
jgi:hypothetical protein